MNDKDLRAYNIKDVSMLTATKTLCLSFIARKSEFVNVKSAWADPFIGSLQIEVDDAMRNVLGINPADPMKNATYALHTIFAVASKDLGIFKVQVECDFESQSGKVFLILSKLGFGHYKAVSKFRNQEAMVELLFTFDANLDIALQNELTAAGIDASLMNRIRSYATVLNNANVTQENLKSMRTELTAEGIEVLNGIYKKAMAICKLARKIFAGRRKILAAFSFEKIAESQTGGHPKPEDKDELAA